MSWTVNRERQPIRYWLARGVLEVMWFLLRV